MFFTNILPGLFLDAQSDYILRPRMSDPEIALLAETLQGKQNYLEFGCGGSTVFAASRQVANIVSVDSDRAWINKVTALACIKPLVESGNIQFFHANIGETSRWGYPKNNKCIDEWPKYWMDVWDTMVGDEVDCVLVDGRFRVACVLNALNKLAPGVPVMIHDFYRRPHYRVVAKYMTCVASVHTLAVFVANTTADFGELREDLAQHSFDPR